MKNAIKSFKSKKDKLSNNNDDDLNLSDDEIFINNTDTIQQEQQNKQKLVSSITITRLNKTRSTQPDTTLTHNNIERLANSAEPITNESSISTNKKRKSSESTSINNNNIKKK
jgi:hypothetical protein